MAKEKNTKLVTAQQENVRLQQALRDAGDALQQDQYALAQALVQIIERSAGFLQALNDPTAELWDTARCRKEFGRTLYAFRDLASDALMQAASSGMKNASAAYGAIDTPRPATEP